MKLVALLASAAIGLAAPAVLSAQSTAQPDTVDPTLPTQLPRTAIPHHYSIIVTPHAERLAFDGHAAIDLDVIKPTPQLTFNAAEMTFSNAALRPAKGGAARQSQRRPEIRDRDRNLSAGDCAGCLPARPVLCRCDSYSG